MTGTTLMGNSGTPSACGLDIGGTGFLTTYAYDAEGRRVQKTSAAGTVNYIYDIAGNQVGEVSSSGNVNRIEAGAGGKHLATYTNGVIYFNHADWLGTERARTDMAGSECETIVSLPFGDGQATSGSCSDASPMHFTGKMRDAETASSPGGTDGLDDFDARYYSSQWGRMMSVDPLYFQGTMLLDPQRLNLYAYARNNPFMWTDPTGEKLFLAGDEGWLMDNVVYPMAGGSATFNEYFHLAGSEVLFNNGVNTTQAPLLLAELVSSAQNYVYYAGNSSKSAEAAALFAGSVGRNGKLTAAGKDRANAFSCHSGSCGTLVGTKGRPQGTLQPVNLGNGDSVFAVIAYNTQTVQTQSEINLGYFGAGNVPADVVAAESAGLGQIIPPANLFIHESAENLAFSSQGNFDYETAHDTAMVREAEIRNDLHLGGGFAGGGVSSTVPK